MTIETIIIELLKIALYIGILYEILIKPVAKKLNKIEEKLDKIIKEKEE